MANIRKSKEEKKKRVGFALSSKEISMLSQLKEAYNYESISATMRFLVTAEYNKLKEKNYENNITDQCSEY